MEGITIYETAFDEKFCQFLYKNAVAEIRRGDSFRRSNFHWKEGMVRSSQAVFVRDYDETLSTLILDGLRERGIVESNNYDVMNYAWTRLSYIPWHNDGHRQSAVTTYLNETWEKDWGGLFLYRHESSDDIRGYAPRFNTAIKNSANVEHATTMITPDAPDLRMTVQLFHRE
jgi:Rps23 Pro-64 3,4-dihydroxylase Tpa1-like proline 4-hydroxylase